MIKTIKSKLSSVYKIVCVMSFFMLDNLIMHPANPQIDSAKIKKILLIRPLGFGDLIVCTPMIRELRKRFPDSEIHLLTSEKFKDVLKYNPNIDKILPLDIQKLRKSPSIFRELINNLKKEKYDLTLDTEETFLFLKRSLIPYLSNAKYRIGYVRGKGFIGFLNTNQVRFKKAHGAITCMDLLRPLGINEFPGKFDVYYSKQDEILFNKFLTDNRIKKRDLLIGIHAGTINPSKRWTIKGFAGVANYLHNKYNAKIILTGVDEEREYIMEIVSKLKFRPIVLVEKTGIMQLYPLIKRLDLLLCLDTSVVHIASATNTPTVAIFGGQTYIDGWFPWNKKNQTIVSNYSLCGKCKYENMDCINLPESKERRCKKPAYTCITSITKEKVISECEKLLKKGRK